MSVRRVIVANIDGTSRVIGDGPAPRSARAVAVPGFESTLVWTTSAEPSIDFNGQDPTPTVTTLLPGPGGTSLIVVRLPPDSVYADPGFDAAAAAAESARNSPGLAELFEADNPGMHTTPTVDYDVVLEGEPSLELTDGLVHLAKGDVVIQHGTRHAWRNQSAKPAVMLFVLIGARTTAPAEGSA